jgi:GH35 family endo-1,4-beta-xylanase
MGFSNAWGAHASRVLSEPSRRGLCTTDFFHTKGEEKISYWKCSAGRQTQHAGRVHSPSPSPRYWFGLTLAMVFIVCAGCVSSRHNFHANQHTEIPFHTVEIGLCEDYPKSSRSLESARRDLELLHAHHIHVLRIAFPWDSIETAPGTYDWSFWDDFVRMATDEFHIRLIPYVCYTPRWASTGTEKNFWRAPPKDDAEFAAFVRTIVTHYKGRIHSWEIWNEPDNPEYWEGSVERFADLLKVGSRAVREADPNATVVLGGLAWNLDFLRALFEKAQVSPQIDVVNLHCYYETWSSDPIENIAEHVLLAERIIREHGGHQPIWLAEIGYSDYRRGARVSPTYRARYSYEHTPEFQAQTLGRAMSSALATGCVQLIAWYRIHDLPAGIEVIGDENNRRLGVLDESGRPKPALQALDFFHELFRGQFRCLDSVTPETRTIRSDAEAHVFEKRDGEEFVAAWLRTVSLFPVAEADGDFRHENLSVILWDRCNRMNLYNELGRYRGTVRLHSNRNQEILHIPLRGDELDVYDCGP